MEQVAFGPFVLYPGSGRLLRDGAPVPVGQRALAVLAALAETPGRTVAKKDLMESARPGIVVEEGNLTVQVAALRKALGAAEAGHDWIVTVPRVGYRLVAPTGKTGDSDAPAIPSLAVVPFANLGGGPEQRAIADGLVDDLITALGRFRSFSVAANHLGRKDEARRLLAEFRRLSPDVTVAGIRGGQPAKASGRIEPILEDLRLAGLPEE